jgi:uncharacterized protein YndB with AHSA1/START domain
VDADQVTPAMPAFDDSAVSQAPPEEVWKLLYDPSRFPDWWAGMETVEVGEPEGAGRRRFTYYPDGRPDFPRPQMLDTARDDRRVVVSCLVSDLRFEWRLEPAEGGSGTRISVHVDIPEQEPDWLETQRAIVSRSLARLAELAAIDRARRNRVHQADHDPDEGGT